MRPLARIESKLDRALAVLEKLNQGVRIMASNDAALTAAVTALQSAVTAEDTGIAAIIAALQGSGSTADPAVADAITKLTALQADITSQTAAINNAVTPPASS